MSDQEENKTATMPFYIHEIEMARAEAIIKRMTWMCAVGWALTFLSVAAAILW